MKTETISEIIHPAKEITERVYILRKICDEFIEKNTGKINPEEAKILNTNLYTIAQSEYSISALIKYIKMFNIVRNSRTYTHKHTNQLSVLRRKNYKTASEINRYIEFSHPDTEIETHLLRLVGNISSCSNISFYTNDHPVENFTYIASYTCDNKFCHVCNWYRQKRIMRVYQKWFTENQTLIEYSAKGKNKVATNSQYNAKHLKNEKIGELEYDIMHLTLTVPHYPGKGYKGNNIYYKELATAFNYMRKENDWNFYVFGGEYGIETAGESEDLHIHIHALLFVRRNKDNRNKLHQFILKKWNRLTINPDNPRETISDSTSQLIMNSNKLLTMEFTKELNPKGATLINLETIYNWDSRQKSKIKEFGSHEMLKAIMETISYHYEPHTMKKETGELDLDMLSRILPVIYNNNGLYRKFGCLQGEKELNIHFSQKTGLKKEFKGIIDLDVDKEIQEPANSQDLTACKSAYVFQTQEKKHKIVLSKRAEKLIHILSQRSETDQALDIIINLALAKVKKKSEVN